MAVIKFTNSNHGLKAILQYITQYAKTEAKLIGGKDCMPESALEEMQTVKRMFGKETGRQYIHLIQSFSPEEKLTHATAHEIGEKLAARFEGFQAVIATHKDRGHIHNHIVINSVNMDTRLKWQQSQKQMQAVKDFSDSLCLERGLTVITEKSHVGYLSRNELKVAEKGQSWKFKLMNAIDSAMETSNTKGDFIANMKRMGYGVKWEDTHKYITYTTPEGQKCRDNKLHEIKYLKEVMENELLVSRTQTQESGARARQSRTAPAGQAVGTAGKSDRRLSDSAVVLRNPTGSVEHFSSDDNRSRKAPSAHAGENRGATDMDGLERGHSPDHEGSHEWTHASRPSVREQLKKGIRQPNRNRHGGGDEVGQQQAFQVGADAPNAGQHADQTQVAVDRDWSGVADSVIGAVVALENLLAVNDPPKEKETKRQVVERKNQQKKKQSHDHEWGEMSL